jgi:hypothetical protein
VPPASAAPGGAGPPVGSAPPGGAGPAAGAGPRLFGSFGQFGSLGSLGSFGRGVPIGLVLVGAGLILVLLSLYLIDWVRIPSGLGVPMHDLDIIGRGGERSGAFGGFAPAYIDFLGLLLFVAVAVSAVLATWPAPPGMRRGQLRIVAAVVVLLAIGLHWVAFSSVSDLVALGFSTSAGNWIGLLGYAVVLVGVIVGPARVGLGQLRRAAP